jgi:hypothetical protein
VHQLKSPTVRSKGKYSETKFVGLEMKNLTVVINCN